MSNSRRPIIEAELPDGTILEFPDGTPEDVIQGAVKRQLGVSGPKPAQPARSSPSLATAGARRIFSDLASVFDRRPAPPAPVARAALRPAAPAIQPPVALAGLASLFNGDDGSSAAGSFGRGAIRGAAPAAAGMAAFGPGFTVGATVGAAGGPAAPVTVPVGGVIGGLISSLAAAYAANEAQEFALDHVPEVERILGQNDAQRSADADQHPWANFGGQLATSLPFLRPGIPGRVPIGEGASAIKRAFASPVTAPAIGATASGAGEAARQLSSDEPADIVKVGMALAAGALLNKPTTLVFSR